MLQSPSLFFSLGCCIQFLGLVSYFFSRDAISDALLLFPNLPIYSSAWDAAVSQLVLQPGMLYPAPWSCLRSCFPGCCVRFPGLVFILFPIKLIPRSIFCWGSQYYFKYVLFGWVAISTSLVLYFSCLRSCLPSCLPAGLGCGICGLVLSKKNYMGFMYLFGVYGNIISFR